MKTTDPTLKKYNYWQWRTLVILMIGYAFFYFVRKNFSIVMPVLETELGLSKTQLGVFLTLNGVIYGVSRFVNGFLSDRLKRKKLFMAAGLMLSAVVNILIGFLPQLGNAIGMLDAEGKVTVMAVYFIGVLLLFNGVFQGMGFPPCSALLVSWVKPSELATKQAIWNTSHSIGAGFLGLMISGILGMFSNSAWQWCFWIPAVFAAVGALLIVLGLKDDPSEVGLPSVVTLDTQSEVKRDDSKESPEFKKKAYNLCVKHLVFGSPVMWCIALCNFCVYVVRFTVLDWGSSILTQYKGMDLGLAATVIGLTEVVGGILGVLLAGWLTDHVFKGKAHHTSLIFTALSLVFLLLFWKSPAGNVVANIIYIVLVSFFIYGPQGLMGIAASNQATKRAAASANGFVGMFGYLSPIVSGILFGYLAEHYGWDSVFVAGIMFGLLGIILLAFIWKAPANGYAKAEELIRKMEEKA